MTATTPDQRDLLKNALLEIKKMRARVNELEQRRVEPIAIVGMGCRLPGHVDGLASFWTLIRDGVAGIEDMPAGRWDAEAIYDPDPGVPGKSHARRGGFVDDVDRFDPFPFRITPREAASMDPQQRVFLEVAWEALEDAGLDLDRLAGSRTGVFVGAYTNDHMLFDYGKLDRIDAYTGTGNLLSFIGGRLSHVLDLRGPCVTVDTACSSGLVGLHLACQSLRAGESDVGVAGGVNMMLQPQTTLMLTKLRALSPEGRCKTFDAAADGYVRSEGCGVVVLKRLSDAVAAGDRIWAVVRGSSVNQNGRSSWITAPNGVAQEAVIQEALAAAGLDPREVGLLEAHGSGTPVGDPVEVEALLNVYGAADGDAAPCLLSSVKPNLGHMESAAGAVGLIKAVLCLHHEAVAPHLNLEELNPKIVLEGTRVSIPKQLTPWPRGQRPRYASVSAFGLSGINGHAVLQEGPARAQPNAEARAAYLLPLSAHSPEALQALVLSYRAMLAEPATADQELADLSYTAGARRAHREHRAAIVATSLDELRKKLDMLSEDRREPGVAKGVASARLQPVFVFPGQGGQWAGMGRELLATQPAFAAAIARCEAAMQQFVDWSLTSVLVGDGPGLDRISVIQPTLFSVQVALSELMASWGVRPGAVIGHSMGEVAAAHVSGALDLDDALRIICRRSQLLERISGEGAMALVELSPEDTRELLRGREHAVSLAVSNSHRSTVISGDVATIDEILAILQTQAVFCRRVKVDVASHSPQVDVLRDELLEILEGIAPHSGAIPMYSTVMVEEQPGAELTPEYWVHNLRDPVQFAATVDMAVEREHTVFVEIGPHPVLLPAIEEGLQRSECDGAAAVIMRRNESEIANVLATAAMLYTRGATLEWPSVNGQGQVATLPQYPWQRQRMWREDAYTAAQRRVASATTSDGSMLGAHIEPVGRGAAHRWQQPVDLVDWPYLGDHRVQGAVLAPGVLFVDMMLEAAQQALGERVAGLRDIAFEAVLALGEEQPASTQVVLGEERLDGPGLEFFSRTADGSWERNAQAGVALAQAGASETRESVDLAAIRARCRRALSAGEHYERVGASGLEYGPAFQGVAGVSLGDDEALARLSLPDEVTNKSGKSGKSGARLHPSLLDASLQVVATLLPTAADNAFYLPVAVDELRLAAFDGERAPSELWCHVRLRSGSEVDAAEGFLGDVALYDLDGRAVLTLSGVHIKSVGEASANASLDGWLYENAWREAPRQAVEAGAEGTWLVVTEHEQAEQPGEGLGEALCAALEKRGGSCIVASMGASFADRGGDGRRNFELDPEVAGDWSQWLSAARAAAASDIRGVVYLPAATALAGEPLTAETALAAQRLVTVAPLLLTQALLSAGFRDPPRLLLITRNVWAGDDAPSACAQAPLWGLGSTVDFEHPELRCTRIDLGAQSAADAAEDIVSEICAKRPSGGDVNSHDERAIKLHGDDRQVLRLTQVRPDEALTRAESTAKLAAAGERAFRLASGRNSGIDGLVWQQVSRPQPGPGEVEIAISHAGVNFLDVLRALDVVSLDLGYFGHECAGTITALGAGVEGLELGQEVMAIAPNSLGRYVLAQQELVLVRPDQIAAPEAAGILVSFLTAFYALREVARLRAGERVLIHAASGGVGLAAVQMAKHLGAEILATAGSEEKRAHLRSLGISHVFDSRSSDFVKGVREATGGVGVDVVLNSLSGEFIPLSLSLLRAHGRFIEIGKRDYFDDRALGLRPFLNNLSFSLVDMASMCVQCPARVREVLDAMMELFRDGSLAPAPTRVYRSDELHAALHTMARGGHIGKLVVALEDPDAILIQSSVLETGQMDSEKSYLITGGCGGLGLSVARAMVQRGARHLMLLGRSGGNDASARAVAEMEAEGAELRVVAADVADEARMGEVIAELRETMPPLGGIIHAAGILDDAVITHLDVARLHRVMAPKMLGAVNLDRLTRDCELDFFVLFSSATTLIGSPGQANYCAANTFLDAFAHHLRARGRRALSINWGAWTEVGLAAAQDNRGARLEHRGLGAMNPEQGAEAFLSVLSSAHAQIGVMSLDVRQWQQYYPKAAGSPLFSELGAEAASAGAAKGENEFVSALRAAPAAQRAMLMEEYVRTQIIEVLRIPADRVDADASFRGLGLDSLMAIEFRNRLESISGLTLSATMVWSYPTPRALAAELLRRMDDGASDGANAPTDDLAEVETLHGDGLANALASELAELEGDEFA